MTQNKMAKENGWHRLRINLFHLTQDTNAPINICPKIKCNIPQFGHSIHCTEKKIGTKAITTATTTIIRPIIRLHDLLVAMLPVALFISLAASAFWLLE